MNEYELDDNVSELCFDVNNISFSTVHMHRFVLLRHITSSNHVWTGVVGNLSHLERMRRSTPGPVST